MAVQPTDYTEMERRKQKLRERRFRLARLEERVRELELRKQIGIHQ